MTYPTYHPVSTTIAPTPTPNITTRPKVYFSYNNSYITEKTTYVGSYLNVSCYISNPSNMQLYPEYYNSNSYVASSYFRNNILYINDEKITEDYKIGTTEDLEVIVPKDMYFVLGDNRENSSDSRDKKIGFIKKENILGKIRIKLWPFNKFKIY